MAAGIDGTRGEAPAATRVDDSRDAFVRTVFWAVLWVSIGVALGAHALEAEPSALLWPVGIVVVLAVWLHLVCRVHRPHPPGSMTATIMLSGLFVALVGLLLVDSSYLLVLFGAYSMVFAFASPARRALILSGIVTIIWLWGWRRWALPSGGIITPVLVWGVLVTINHFSEQVADQNRERGELLDELRRTRAELAAAERDRGMFAERERLAGEIHDTLAQGFTSIVLVSEATRARAHDLAPETIEYHLEMIEDTARTNLVEARRLVAALGPVALDGHSLCDAIGSTAARFQSRTGIAVTTDLAGEVALGGTGDIVALRVVQEALANCEKHASAAAVSVSLHVDDTGDGPGAVVTISDDGRGFDRGHVEPVAGGLGGAGLELARRRVEGIGGSLMVRSTPGVGTEVAARIPRGGDPHQSASPTSVAPQ